MIPYTILRFALPRHFPCQSLAKSSVSEVGRFVCVCVYVEVIFLQWRKGKARKVVLCDWKKYHMAVLCCVRSAIGFIDTKLQCVCLYIGLWSFLINFGRVWVKVVGKGFVSQNQDVRLHYCESLWPCWCPEHLQLILWPGGGRCLVLYERVG